MGAAAAGESDNRKLNDVKLRHVLAGKRHSTCIAVMHAASLCGGLAYLWRFEGVVCGEVYGQEENPALVRTVILMQGERSSIISLPHKCSEDT